MQLHARKDNAQAGKQIRAIVVGLAVWLGTVETAPGEKRGAIPVTIERPDANETSE